MSRGLQTKTYNENGIYDFSMASTNVDYCGLLC